MDGLLTPDAGLRKVRMYDYISNHGINLPRLVGEMREKWEEYEASVGPIDWRCSVIFPNGDTNFKRSQLGRG